MPFRIKQSTDGGINITDGVTTLGTVEAPTAGTVTVKEFKFGPFVRTDFTLTAARIVVTDGAGSGSHGALTLYTFPQCAITFLGSRQDYTAFAEGAALTGAAGDAVFEIGVATTAIAAAADGTLGNGANENVGQAVSVTLSSGTGAGTAVNGCIVAGINGTASASTLSLNWSGTAATIDATSYVNVTGTISVLWAHMGDD